MSSLAARIDTEWRSFTPLHEHTLDRAREVVAGEGGPFAGAIVGVYGSGKSTLAFTLLREAPAHGAAAIWDEAAPFIERLLPGDARVIPQVLAARARAWTSALFTDRAARQAYAGDLEERGHGAVAAAVIGQIERGASRVVLLLDELEQAHHLLWKRIAADDGQPLRALIDACGPEFRLLLAYAPESYHSVGDADRGRLAYLPVPALDVGSIQATFGLGRGEANFAWWASRGRARGVIHAVRSVIEPFRKGAFDAGLDDLGDALDALPGVFGVPAILRDGLSHAETRALVDLRPFPCETAERGVACALGDRDGVADRIKADLARRIATPVDLAPVANELVGVLSAVAGDDDCAHLTMDDFRAALRTAEARAIESGRQREPIERFADQAVFVFASLGDMAPLEKRLRIPLATLAEERFPSPFTDPYLPFSAGRPPSEGELARRFRAIADAPAPLVVSAERDFAAFASEAALAGWIEAGGIDGSGDPVRAVILDGTGARSPIVDLARAAGRISTRDVGPFHATFLKCLALRAAVGDPPYPVRADALPGDLRADRQLARKIAWHLGRIAIQLRDAKPRPSAAWTAASRFVRDERFRGAIGRLKSDSPALLALLVPIRPPAAQDRRLLARTARLFDGKEPIRRIARQVNPGGRLSGAAVVVDELLPSAGETPRWTERKVPGAADFGEVADAFAADPGICKRLARWLFPEDPGRLEALLAFYAGALPDIAEEEAQLEAIQGLERTHRITDAILADLEGCTGRPRESLRGLRLGSVTDQVRAAGGPVAALRALGAEARAAEACAPWVRSLAVWLCGVFADRILTGVEKEQAEVGAWEAAAAAARDVGARTSDVERALGEAGADACVEIVALARRRIAGHLESAGALERELRALRSVVTALESLSKHLRVASAALAERGVSVAAAIAAYQPDEDAAREHQALFRRVPEWLDEIEGPCPPPGGRGLVEYVEVLRRHADATRRERLRMRLEAAVDITVDPELRVDADAVIAIERAWALIPLSQKAELRSEIEARAIESVGELERWIEEAVQKAKVVAEWRARQAPFLRDADARGAGWSRRLAVTTEDVREMDRQRSRAMLVVSGLPGVIRPSVVEAITAAALPGDVDRVYARIGDAAQRFADEFSAISIQARNAGAVVPAPIPLDSPEAAIAAVKESLAVALEERDRKLSRAREIGVALGRWGEKTPAIPAELNVAQAGRLAAREEGRLRSLLAKKRDDLAAWLHHHALADALAPADPGDVVEWSRQLESAQDRRIGLSPYVDALARLGAGLPAGCPADWDGVRAALLDHLSRAEDERRALARRCDEARERALRLGGSPAESPIVTLALPDARAIVEATEADVERLRAARLSGCSPEARALYAAIGAGDTAALPAAVAELSSLGLIRTIEDAR